MELKESKTQQNLKDAFAGESQANRRYLYFASKADVEGYNDVASVFRSTAEGETGHAHGHLDYLKPAGDYVELGLEVNFYTVVEAARRRGEVAIGYRQMAHAKDAARAYGVVVNPKKSAKVTFSEADQVVVLAEE